MPTVDDGVIGGQMCVVVAMKMLPLCSYHQTFCQCSCFAVSSGSWYCKSSYESSVCFDLPYSYALLSGTS